MRGRGVVDMSDGVGVVDYMNEFMTDIFECGEGCECI